MKTKLLKLLVVMTISITAIFALGITASAATAGDFTITLTEGVGDPVVDIDYTYADGVLTILSDKDITIKNTTPSTSTTNRIEVAYGISANITLAGVNIDVSGTENAAAFKIADNSTGNVTITIADGKTNTLKSGYNCAGLQKNGAYISETQGKLTITGTCSLIAPGGFGAGIGGGISRSTITAIGGERGAGIGGGSGGSGSNITITISGGTVTATGGKYGAGIGGGFGGGGFGGSGSYITISDGTVTATGGTGIGGGIEGNGSNIEISGGTVTATGDTGGAGIGGGYKGSGSYITISGGEVTAIGNIGAGIGGGFEGSGSNITISGGSVKASSIGCTPTDGTANATPVYLLELTSATSSLKIDGKDFPINHGSDGKVYVYLPEGEHTVISDENSTTNKYAKKADNKLEAIGTAFTITGTDLVYGTDYTYPASTGVLTILSDTYITIANTNPSTPTTNRIEVANGVSANITLAGVNIDVSSQSDTAAFKIADNSTGNVTITLADGTTNTLKSGGNCAGLQKNGAYISETQGKLTITGTGSLTATGGKHAAGIGGGDGCDGSYIEISGGTVTAQGGEDGAGIGGGAGGSGSNIKISGGVVIANGGYGPYGGAGIGGGSYGSGSNITISGGAVTATGGGAVTAIGGGRGAGIGGGFSGSGSNIKISGGAVTATGGAGGAGIGGGGDGSGSYIEISGGEVTATGGTGIGGGIRGSGSYITISGGSVKADSIDCTPTDGTANATPVYLLELDVDGTSAVTINGKAYPTKHFDENKVYIYLPAKTAANPNEVAVGNETTKYCYINAKWLKVVDSPEADDTEFTYDGEEQTYTIAESDYYVIAGNKQTNAGTYTVTVALNDKDNTVWNDGTTDDKTFTFTIAKATVTVTAKSYTIKVGEALPTYAYDVTGLVNGETIPIDVTISCTADGNTAGPFDIVVSGVADSDNYAFAFVNGKLTVVETSAGGETGGESSGTEGGAGGSSYIPSGPTTPTHPTDPVVPDDKDDTDGGNTDSSDNKDIPQIKDENGKAGWLVIEDEIKDAEDGDKIIVDMNGATEVPKDIFKAVKGKDIDLVIELDNGFTWTINGKDVTDPADIDLGVNEGSTIPVKVINEVTGECEYITLTLSHNGDFGFKAVLAVDLGEENEGMYANLYYVDGDKSELICSDKIDGKGKADLTFTHASEYIVVIDVEAHGENSVSGDTDDDSVSGGSDGSADSADDDENPPTGITVSFAGVIISTAAVVIARKRKDK